MAQRDKRMRLRLAEPLTLRGLRGVWVCGVRQICGVHCAGLGVSLVVKRGTVDKILVQGRYTSCVDCLGVWKAIRFLSNAVYIT